MCIFCSPLSAGREGSALVCVLQSNMGLAFISINLCYTFSATLKNELIVTTERGSASTIPSRAGRHALVGHVGLCPETQIYQGA